MGYWDVAMQGPDGTEMYTNGSSYGTDIYLEKHPDHENRWQLWYGEGGGNNVTVEFDAADALEAMDIARSKADRLLIADPVDMVPPSQQSAKPERQWEHLRRDNTQDRTHSYDLGYDL